MVSLTAKEDISKTSLIGRTVECWDVTKEEDIFSKNGRRERGSQSLQEKQNLLGSQG